MEYRGPPAIYWSISIEPAETNSFMWQPLVQSFGQFQHWQDQQGGAAGGRAPALELKQELHMTLLYLGRDSYSQVASRTMRSWQQSHPQTYNSTRVHHESILRLQCEGRSVSLRVKLIIRTTRLAAALVELVQEEEGHNQTGVPRLLSNLIDDNMDCFPHLTLALAAGVPASESGLVLRAYCDAADGNPTNLPFNQKIVGAWPVDSQVSLRGQVTATTREGNNKSNPAQLKTTQVQNMIE